MVKEKKRRAKPIVVGVLEGIRTGRIINTISDVPKGGVIGEIRSSSVGLGLSGTLDHSLVGCLDVKVETLEVRVGQHNISMLSSHAVGVPFQKKKILDW